MEPRWIKHFLYSVGGILLAAAAIRFVIASGDSPFLALPEPVLGIPLRYAVLAVGGIELIVALICLFGGQIAFQIGWLFWLSTDFVAYWLAVVWMSCPLQGTCLGSLDDPLHLSRGTIGSIMAWMPVYMLIGSYAALPCLWRGRAALPRSLPSELKMFCPSCGAHIQFAGQNLDRKIPCPLCRVAITLRAPGNLKMSCSFCHEHIEFPSHALGQRISCPHCKEDITLKESG